MPIFGRGADGGPRRGLPLGGLGLAVVIAGGAVGRLVIALIIAGGSVVTYLARTTTNPVTGEKQHVSLSVNQEIALGLESVADMERQFGGVDPDPQRGALVEAVGKRIV